VSWIPDDEIEDVADSEIPTRIILQRLLDGKWDRHSPFLRLGWSDELLHWVASVLGVERHRVSDEIGQLGAASNRVLLRINVGRDRSHWFKAIAEVGNSEFEVTKTLSNLFPEYLPTLDGVRDDWKGWLMQDAGRPVEISTSAPAEISHVIGARLAELQQTSVPYTKMLLRCGFIDQRISQLRHAIRSMRPALEYAALSQRLPDVPHIDMPSLRRLTESFEDACCVLEETGLPDALVHNDLTRENILVSSGSCVFADWAQAGIGNPLVALDQLRVALAQDDHLASWIPRVVRSYQLQWRGELQEEQIDRATVCARLVSIATHLASRKRWIMSEYQHNLGLQSYVRSLLLQMERAAQCVRLGRLIEAHETSLSA
jgi:hypothetical protein